MPQHRLSRAVLCEFGAMWMLIQHNVLLVEALVWYRGGVQKHCRVTKCMSLPHVLTDH